MLITCELQSNYFNESVTARKNRRYVLGGRGLPLRILVFLRLNSKKKEINTESKMERDCKRKEKERLKVK